MSVNVETKPDAKRSNLRDLQFPSCPFHYPSSYPSIIFPLILSFSRWVTPIYLVSTYRFCPDTRHRAVPNYWELGGCQGQRLSSALCVLCSSSFAVRLLCAFPSSSSCLRTSLRVLPHPFNPFYPLLHVLCAWHLGFLANGEVAADREDCGLGLFGWEASIWDERV